MKNLSNVVLSEEDYTYDAAGNITDAPDSCFAYDTNNRLTWYNGDAVGYDADGNMLSAVLNGTTGTYFTYDSANRLISSGGHTYTYNAEDVRIRNLCSGEDTKYTYNTNCKLSKLLWKDTNGTVTKYVYGRGLIGEETGSSFTTYHFDCRGSTVALTNANGVITDTFEYDTYGGVISRTGTSSVIFLYNGRDGVVTDTNGLIYMRARYYSPDMRRFINADIVAGVISEAVTLNRFAYANGNPVSNIDPFGLSSETKGGDDGWLSGLKNWWDDTVDTVTDWWDSQDDTVQELISLGIGVVAIGCMTATAVIIIGAVPLVAAAAASATVNLTTTYVATKITGQSYSIDDSLAAVVCGFANAFGTPGILINGALTAGRTAHVNYKNGASLEASLVTGVIAGTLSAASISNLANLGSDTIEVVIKNASADLVFGMGYNSMAAAISRGAVESNEQMIESKK